MLVGVFVGGVLPYPARLSAPVTLTLTLSRRAGEGKNESCSATFQREDRRFGRATAIEVRDLVQR